VVLGERFFAAITAFPQQLPIISGAIYGYETYSANGTVLASGALGVLFGEITGSLNPLFGQAGPTPFMFAPDSVSSWIQ
jgi:hypothetical protein